MTERKLLESQLRQSQKMEAVGRLAAGVAHDYNNVLTGVNGFAELIVLGLREGDPLRKHAEEIVKAGGRATALTKQLLAFSRKQILRPRVLNPNKVVEGVVTMLRRLVGEDVEIRTELSSDLGNVNADPGQLEQVLLNLVVNARDAMPSGGRLTIETENGDGGPGGLVGPHVKIAVSDSGSGMTKDTLSHLFEPFFTTKPPGKGTGLGLSTVYGIIKQSGGSILVDSEVGLGTTFEVFLPRIDAASEESGATPLTRHSTRGSETILLVEDDDLVREFASVVLKSSGYEVLEAADGNQALLACESQPRCVDLVVSDLIMPRMSGHELVDRILKRYPHTRALFTSGDASRRGALAGGAPFLQKPFSQRTLLDRVRGILDGRASTI